ncbi:MAG: type II/IV secretion system protein [Nitrospira sp.]|nr:type II/IV secretion system protein [Nitrospira sp.]
MSELARARATSQNQAMGRIGPGDFARFRDFLVKRVGLTPDKVTTIAKTSPAKLYAAGTVVGIDESDMAHAIAEFLNVPYADQLNAGEPQLDILPPSFCLMHGVIPLRDTAGQSIFAVSNPFDWELMDAIEKRSVRGHRPRVIIAAPLTITTLLRERGAADKQTGKSLAATTRDDLFDILETVTPQGEAEERAGKDDEYEVLSAEQMQEVGHLPPVVRLVNMILSDAVKRGASDIHFEPHETVLQVRFRVDGVLIDAMKIPKPMQAPTTSRIKIISGLDIAEHRKPQDGRSRMRLQARRIDLRVSILPSQFGEKIVIRLLDGSMNLVHLDRLTLAPDILRSFKRSLSNPQGVVLVTGPTGSGKSTTLYAALNQLKTPTKNIITVENPIEYQMVGVTQVQIEPKAGMTFAAGLRSILRQDPNIIMVGEIRDRETAEIAMEAAQTGHLLLSTVHTNDSTGTIIRLLDLGIEPFQVAASVIAILGQRLVRKICPACAVERPPSAEALELLGDRATLPDIATWKGGAGCQACQQSGYKGRMGIHELLEVTDQLRELISARAPEHVIRDTARAAGMRTLLEDGIAKAASGLTTLEEVLRVAPQYDAKPTGTDKAAAPLTTAQPIPASQPISAPAAVDTGAATEPMILIIEDEEDTRAMIELLLKKAGYRTMAVADGIEALLAMGKHAFDLVLSDINMPNLDGFTLLTMSKQKGLTAPVIFLTADNNTKQEQKGLELGALDYITKPIKKEVLLLRVKRAIGK